MCQVNRGHGGCKRTSTCITVENVEKRSDGGDYSVILMYMSNWSYGCVKLRVFVFFVVFEDYYRKTSYVRMMYACYHYLFYWF